MGRRRIRNGIKNCGKCGASAMTISPAWYNDLKGYIVKCITKMCGERTKQYKRNGDAIRYWNAGYREQEQKR